MNIIKRFFKNIVPSNKTLEEKVSKRITEPTIGGFDLDDQTDVQEDISKIVKIEPTKVGGEVKKKPGRPKGSTAKKTPSKKTPAKKTPSKKA
jgi:hypothetical protein